MITKFILLDTARSCHEMLTLTPAESNGGIVKNRPPSINCASVHTSATALEI